MNELITNEKAFDFLEENEASVKDCMNIMIGTLEYLNFYSEKSEMTDEERSNLDVQISYLKGYAQGVIDRQESRQL